MADPARKLATYADLLAVPEPWVAEILDGVLYTQARPAAPHTRASSVLGGELMGPFDRGRGGPGGWILLDEPELHLAADVLVPDLAGWRRSSMPSLPMEKAAIDLAPDWICEVLSPANEATDRGIKMDIYAREQVEFAWLIQPLAQTLEAYRWSPSGWLRLGLWSADAVVHAEPFEALALDLAALWSR